MFQEDTGRARYTYRAMYRQVLADVQRQCPPPESSDTGKRERQKHSKERDLPERLVAYEDDGSRLMENLVVPSIDNEGKDGPRMATVR